jgi:hypothetical protein
MNARLKLAAAAAMLAFAVPAAAYADDRKPEGAELAAITEALNAQGYSSWDEIEWSHDMWDVNDAEYSDGKDYDLTLDPNTLQVVTKE